MGPIFPELKKKFDDLILEDSDFKYSIIKLLEGLGLIITAAAADGMFKLLVVLLLV